MMPNYHYPASLTDAEKSDVVFVEIPELKPVTLAALEIQQAQAAAATIKVRVNNPYRVSHEGKPFVGGQTLTVPDDVEHSRWIDSGWVTKVKGK
jgi:hypothetical protein